MTGRKWTSLSFSNHRRDLPGEDDRMTARARLARLFGRESDPLKEAQREDQHRTEAERRDHTPRDAHTQINPSPGRASRMVANDRPQPVHKPILALARDVDRSSFNTRWEAERRDALRAELKQGKQELLTLRSGWDDTRTEMNTTDARADAGDPKAATRKMFKAFRRAEAQHKPIMARSDETIARAETFITRRSR